LNAPRLVILSERAARARAKDLEKQILRACGAQDDRLARFAKQRREQKSRRAERGPRPGVTVHRPLASSPLLNAPRLVILSERAARARAKDLALRMTGSLGVNEAGHGP